MPTNINSQIRSFGELLMGNNQFMVPLYQRDYSWTETEVDELWSDIISTMEEVRPEHFMGAVVVIGARKPNQIIDGQQRLVTITLALCAIRDIYRENGDEEGALAISQDYLGSLNRRTRTMEPNLTLNERNHEFYRTYIIEPKSIDLAIEQSRKRNIDKSNKLLVDAYLFLHSKIAERVSSVGDYRDVLIQLEETIREKLVTILISVTDEADAYLIFETLNDRGLDLSVADLLKGYFFSRAGGRLTEVKKKWEEMTSALSKHDLTKFIRHYWMSTEGIVRERDLYRTIISRQDRTPAGIFALTKRLHDAADIYGALENPDSPIWDNYDSELRGDIVRLRLFRVSQCYPVLLAAKETLPENMFPKVLRMMVVLSFRYNVICSFGANILERAYSDTAKFIRQNKPKRIKDIFSQVKSFYPSDADFQACFGSKSLSNPPLVRYILGEINNTLQGNREMITNPNEARLNLEHILPQSPTGTWLQVFTHVNVDDYVNRLGNLTLVDSSINRNVGNASFQEKCKEVFSKSTLQITQDITKYNNWGPDEVEDRQKKLAKIAAKIWRIDY